MKSKKQDESVAGRTWRQAGSVIHLDRQLLGRPFASCWGGNPQCGLLPANHLLPLIQIIPRGTQDTVTAAIQIGF